MLNRLSKNITFARPSIHFSIDDCISGLEELYTENPKHLFDSDYYGFLKKLNEETCAGITCYLFYENKGILGIKNNFDLSMADGRYKKEFEQSHSWLKFGVHALNMQTPMTTQTNEEIVQLINNTEKSILTFAGKNSFVNTCRPHYCSAHRDACNIMKKHGIDLLFTPEDNRKIVACLTPDTVKRIAQGGFYNDPNSKFLLVHTSFRIEDLSKSLKDMKQTIDRDILQYGVSAIYTHEYELVKSGKNSKLIRDNVLNLLRYCHEKKLSFTM